VHCTTEKCIQVAVALRLAQVQLNKQCDEGECGKKDLKIKLLEEQLEQIRTEKAQLIEQNQILESEAKGLRIENQKYAQGEVQSILPCIIGTYMPRCNRVHSRVEFDPRFQNFNSRFACLMEQTKTFVNAWLLTSSKVEIPLELLEYLGENASEAVQMSTLMASSTNREFVMRNVLNQALVKLIFKGCVIHRVDFHVAQSFQLEDQLLINPRKFSSASFNV